MLIMFKMTILFGYFFFANIINGQIPAFPGAEGFGRFATGGRGGDVYHVTNLNDDGKGSLRYGIKKMNGPRTIIFDVSGTIALNDKLKVKDPNLTIAGQTAPGDGITLAGGGLYIDASNVIVRYIRCRLGDQSGGDDDAVSINGGSNIIIDHVTASWSVDETFSCQSGDVDSLTVQWCMITESLRYSHHAKGAHGFGGIIGSLRQSFHHNLYAHHSSRSPKVSGRRHCVVDFRNNVIYNWGYNNCYDGTKSYLNWANNYYKAGLGTSSNVRDRIFNLSDNPVDSSNDGWEESNTYITSLYAEGNFVDGYPAVTADNWSGGIDFDNGATEAKNRDHTPFDFPAITEQTAEEAYPLVLESAGASITRDVIDERIVNEVISGTATYSGSISGAPGLIDSQNDVGGWPELSCKLPKTDTDRDGMPDEWEIAYGLNLNDPEDRNDDDDLDGYTNLEEYLNSIISDPGITDIEINNHKPQNYVLKQNYPNPFNPKTVIPFNLAKTGHTRLTVYNMLGQNVATLVDEELDAGTYKVFFNADDLPSGVYFYRIQSGNFSMDWKMLLAK